MLRAVEILAKLHERARAAPNVAPPPLEHPIVLASDRITFALGRTARATVEGVLGTATAYPARGWHTYALAAGRERRLLSLFYAAGGRLVGVECYLPRTQHAPPMPLQPLGSLRFVPGEIALGASAGSVAHGFVPAVGGPGPVVFDRCFEARFDGGVAYVMAREGVVERLALYAQAKPSA